MLPNLRGFYEGRKFNLAANHQSLKILLLSHMLSQFSLLQLIKMLITRRICLPNYKICTQTNKKLCYQTQEGLCNSSKISNSQHHPYSLPFFQKYYKHSIHSLSIHHLLKVIILLLPRKVVGISILKTQIKNYVRKIEH